MTTLTPADDPGRFRPSQETAVAAVEAHARAAIESRYIIAMKRPRDLDEARQDLLKECDRPGFADAAIYNKPIGKGIEGLSVRFAEAAVLAMRNLYVETPAIYDDQDRRIVRVGVTDLESNVSYTKDVTIRKEVERRKLQEGEIAISQRLNSYGDTVYLRKATDDEILDKEGALISKAYRTLALRVVPGWLQAECLKRCYATMKKKDAEDPDAAKRRIADAFASLGVRPTHLKTYLGHELETCSPAELVELKALYTTIRDGEATWREALEFKHADPETKKGTRTEELKQEFKDRKKKAGKKKQERDPEDGTHPKTDSGEAPLEEQADPVGEAADKQKTVEEAIAEAETSEGLTRLMAEINHSHNEKLIDTKRWGDLSELVHQRTQEIAKAGKRGKE